MEPAPSLGQRKAARQAVKERHSQSRLKSAYLLGDSTLGDAQVLGG
jgi:hypothetical protein